MSNGCAQREGSWAGVTGESMPQQPEWYAIRTRSRHEKMVSQQLEQQGIETFLPLVKRTHKWSDRTKEVELPLFAGYNFVRVIQSSPERLRVLRAHGVAGFVGINGAGGADGGALTAFSGISAAYAEPVIVSTAAASAIFLINAIPIQKVSPVSTSEGQDTSRIRSSERQSRTERLRPEAKYIIICIFFSRNSEHARCCLWLL